MSATEFIGRVRTLDLDKPPGLSETIDWVSALTVLGASSLVRSDIVRTLGAIVKTPDDRESVLAALGSLGYEDEAQDSR